MNLLVMVELIVSDPDNTEMLISISLGPVVR